MTAACALAMAAPPVGSRSDPVLVDSFESCQQLLQQLNVGFAVGAAQPGVADPVRVFPPLNGVTFNNLLSPGAELYMDCRLALALHHVAGDLVARGIDTVDFLAIYNYRCIAGTGDPPNCTLSDHSFATAIDMASFSGGGTTYSVQDDWVIDPAPDDTCTAATANPKDEFLHRIACGWHDAGLFKIILTPNYNANYRNHIHADLTRGANYIQ
jgi:hypothetical protein